MQLPELIQHFVETNFTKTATLIEDLNLNSAV